LAQPHSTKELGNIKRILLLATIATLVAVMLVMSGHQCLPMVKETRTV
jgi:hypothetical protein